MIGPKPKFIDSPYFVMEENNWHLKDGAPAEVVKEFNEYMEINDYDGIKPVKKSLTQQVNELIKDFSK